MSKKGKGAEGFGARSSRWADLPEELLAHIAEGLHARVDFLRFCATCSSWRSAARSILPAGMTSNNKKRYLQVPALIVSRDDNTIQERFYTAEGFTRPFDLFSMFTVYHVQRNHRNPASRSSNKSRLACVCETPYVRRKDKRLRIEFLAKTALGYGRTKLNLLDLSMSELCKYYVREAREGLTAQYFKYFDVDIELIRKLAIIFLRRSVAGEYAAVALYGCYGKLAFLKSSREGIWTSIDDYQAGYNDVIDYNGKFYAVHCTGKLLKIELSSKVTEIASPTNNGTEGTRHKILVESAGDLLLLDKHIERSKINKRGAMPENLWFKVYKLSEEQENQKLVEISSLGDTTLFLSNRYYSYSVVSAEQQLPPNCIYFMEQCDNAYHIDWNSRWILDAHEPAVFNLEDGTYKRMKN